MRQRGRNIPSLRQIYRRLFASFGPQHWWPAQRPFEVMVGAILTQATAWHNVEQAIARLKGARALSAHGLLRLGVARLQRLIRPAGYFRQKAMRLQAFSRWYVTRYRADARRMFRTSSAILRNRLLDLPGIGPETADSILLYAGQQPVFVVDAYTRRIFSRHHLMQGDESYDAIQRFVTDQLPRDPHLFNEFHALLVAVGKQHCHRRDPDCPGCPLDLFPHHTEVTSQPSEGETEVGPHAWGPTFRRSPDLCSGSLPPPSEVSSGCGMNRTRRTARTPPRRAGRHVVVDSHG